MSLTLRPGTLEDASACGVICYHAFKTIAEQHNFLSAYTAVEMAKASMVERFSNPGFFSVVAEENGQVVGSNFLDERSPISGLGPITVDPKAQNRSIGRQLMQATLAHSAERQALGVRLVHAAYHTRAMCLYASLGFDAREMVAKVTGPPPLRSQPSYMVRPATPSDLDACNQVCEQVHGHHRSGELRDAIEQGTAQVVEYEGRLSGYTTVIGVTGHAVGHTTGDIKALIGAATEFGRGGFLIPLRNGDLLRWCLAQGLRIAVPQSLMSQGFYREPTGAYLPSVLY